MAARRLLARTTVGAAGAVAVGGMWQSQNLACERNVSALAQPNLSPSKLDKQPSVTTTTRIRSASELHPNLVVLESPAVRCLFTTIRDENTVHLDFSQAADRLMRILAEEGLAQLPSVHPIRIRTPCGFYDGLASADASDIAAVSIVRAGDTLLEAVRRVNPGVAVGKILIQRDENSADKRPILLYVKVPQNIADRQVMLVDPMLATGGSAVCAIRELVKRGVKEENIVFLNVVSCPEGLAHMAATHPKVKIVTAAVDEKLNEHKYIVPGLGDFGDRYLGTDVPAGRKAKPPPAHLG